MNDYEKDNDPRSSTYGAWVKWRKAESDLIGNILKESVIPELEAHRERLSILAQLEGKKAEVNSLRDSVDAVCNENARLREELAIARNFEGYRVINKPNLPMTLENIKERLLVREFEVLMEHATCLACLQGNSFPFCIEQYCLDAYVNLWQNSAVGKDCKIPNLYPVTAAEYYCGWRGMDQAKKRDAEVVIGREHCDNY